MNPAFMKVLRLSLAGNTFVGHQLLDALGLLAERLIVITSPTKTSSLQSHTVGGCGNHHMERVDRAGLC